MTHLNDTMPTNLLATHRKYAHLTKEERVMIATLKSQGLSNRAIGRQLGVNHQTINNELKRGTVRQIRRQKFNGKTYDYPYHIYSYEAGQNIYLKYHQRSGPFIFVQYPLGLTLEIIKVSVLGGILYCKLFNY